MKVKSFKTLFLFSFIFVLIGCESSGYDRQYSEGYSEGYWDYHDGIKEELEEVQNGTMTFEEFMDRHYYSDELWFFDD
jgi:predicted restriction endonuclease